MAPITQIFLDYLNPRKIYLWLLLLVILLAAAAYYVVNRNKNKFRERESITNVPNAEGSGDLEIMIFKVDWCPHCKQAETPWGNFKDAYHGKRIGNYVVSCVEYNVTEKDNGEDGYQSYVKAKAVADKYKIDGYPTIKMVKDGQVIDFDAKITTYALEKFVDNMI